MFGKKTIEINKLIGAYTESDVYGEVIPLYNKQEGQPVENYTKTIIEKVINHIAFKQGWEETGDIYRKEFGIKERFNKAGK